MKNLRLLFLIFLTAACAQAAEGPVASKTEPTQQWSQIYGGPEESGTAVIRDSESWKNLWQKLGSGEAPAVDFSTHMAVAIFMGSRPTGGYSVSIEKIERKRGKIVVRYREKHPAPGAFTIQALTSPYHIQLLPRSDWPVVFKKR